MTLLPWKREDRESRPEAPGFEELAMPLLPSLYNVARWLARDPTEAEDLVQETFLKALRGFPSFELGTNFKAWIFRILRNTYLTSRTGLAAMRTVSLEEQMDGRDDSVGSGYIEAAIDRQTPEVNLMRLADRAALQAAMEELPPPLLEVVLLCDLEEMKYKEIAAILDMPIGTVMSRIARARAALRRALPGGAMAPREVGS
jgi:RNA polymerase sigma-70 factor, ECF subfamily